MVSCYTFPLNEYKNVFAINHGKDELLVFPTQSIHSCLQAIWKCNHDKTFVATNAFSCFLCLIFLKRM